MSDIDMASDGRAEMILASTSGFAILHENGSGVWGSGPLDLRFHLDHGEAFAGTEVQGGQVRGTTDVLVSVMDFNKSGGADLLFRHENGITVLGKSASGWTFDVIATHHYGSWIGGWNFGAGDWPPPMTGDFDGDGQNDFPIRSLWGLGVLTTSGLDFGAIGLAPYEALPIVRPSFLYGVGKFDHSGRHRLLFKRLWTPTAHLTADPTSIPAGTSSTLTWSSTHAGWGCGGNGLRTDGAASGNVSVAPVETTTYEVTCGNLEAQATASAVVTVHPRPTAQLTADPTSIPAGASSRLAWSSTNASSCTGTNFSTGGAASGNASVAPAATTTYAITCTGAGGSATASTTVTVPASVLEDTKTVFLQMRQVVSGPIPYFAQFPSVGSINNGKLKSIKNLSNVFNPMNLSLVKRGFSSADCSNPSAVVLLKPGESTTPNALSAIYGSAAPSLPVGILACIITQNPTSPPNSVGVDVTYTYTPTS